MYPPESPRIRLNPLVIYLNRLASLTESTQGGFCGCRGSIAVGHYARGVAAVATAGRDRQWYTQHPQGQSSLVSSSLFAKAVVSTVVFGTVLSSSAACVGSEGHAEQQGSPATELAGIFQVPEQRARAALLYCHGDKQAAADLLSTTSDKGKYKLDKFKRGVS